MEQWEYEKMKRIQMDMVIDRGFDITMPDEKSLLDDENYSFEDFINDRKKISDTKVFTINLLSATYQNRNIKLFVFYLTPGKGKKQVAKSQLAEIHARFEPEPGDEDIETQFIIITTAQIGSVAGEELRNSGKFIQTFRVEELLYNPTKHISVSKHELLDEEEIQELLYKFKITKSKLPLIKNTDPICKWYGWKAGDVIRVNRDQDNISTLSRFNVNYRLVTL